MKIGIISIYPPPKSKHAKLGGVGSYTKNLMNSLKSFDNDYFIFSNKTEKKEIKYEGDEGTIFYCWDSSGIKYPYQIISKIIKQKIRLDLIHIQYEVFLYGGVISAISFPLLLILLKLRKIPVAITIHQVVPLSKIDRKFLSVLGVNGTPFLFKKGLKIIFRIISYFSKSIIVHEKIFKSYLIEDYKIKNHTKICIIPHGIEDQINLIDPKIAKNKLNIRNEKIVLFFGYLSRYKGIELLLDSYNYLNRKDTLYIIAGGVHPRLKDDYDYKNYIKSLKHKSDKKNIIFSGFVKEENISLYFSAADIIIFPYTIVMSSSGPMALAIAYEKPFLASSSYKNVLKNELIFNKNPKDLAVKINEFFNSEELDSEIKQYIKELKKQRIWSEVGKHHLDIYKNIIK